ncbi:SPI1 isoform 2 [Pan troglodytes]|uniref:Spi-1 proto-oncogene n=6 Tax=Hominoidea TaxID=314295 RepID=F5GZ94_HUMAN|nr:SPI1 isoform 2 [Pan troglodytes]
MLQACKMEGFPLVPPAARRRSACTSSCWTCSAAAT